MPPNQTSTEISKNEAYNIHYEYEYLFYELYPIFQDHMRITAYKSLPLVKSAALNYLEFQCSPIHGFGGQIHCPGHPHDIKNIATSFDSALTYTFLREEDFDPLCMASLLNATRKHRRPSGVWGYFPPIHQETGTSLFPDDIDDTSIPMLALFAAGQISKEECTRFSHWLCDQAFKDESGALGTWLPNLEKQPNGQPRKFLYEKPITDTKKKVDIGCLANALTFFSAAGDLNGGTILKPSLDYIAQFVAQLDDIIQGKTVHSDSQFGNSVRGSLAVAINQSNLDKMSALDIACIVHAFVYLKLAYKKNKSINKKVHDMVHILPKLQQADGSFEKSELFKMTHAGHYGGSSPVTSALVVSAIGRYMRLIIKGESYPGDMI